MLESALISLTSFLIGLGVASTSLTKKYDAKLLQQMEKNQSLVEQQINAEKKALEDFYQLRDKHTVMLHEKEFEHKSLMSLNTKAESTIDDLHQQVFSYQKQIHQLSTERDSAMTLSNELSVKYNNAATLSKELTESLNEHKSMVSDLEDQLAQSNTECQEVKNNYVAMANQANDEIGKLQSMLKTYHQALEETTKQLATTNKAS